jgi:hypothetical protein
VPRLGWVSPRGFTQVPESEAAQRQDLPPLTHVSRPLPAESGLTVLRPRGAAGLHGRKQHQPRLAVHYYSQDHVSSN